MELPGTGPPTKEYACLCVSVCVSVGIPKEIGMKEYAWLCVSVCVSVGIPKEIGIRLPRTRIMNCPVWC